MTKGAMIKPDSLAALDIPINLAAHPLWDQELDEPYLPLPGHPELRLTPNHVGDDADIVCAPIPVSVLTLLSTAGSS